MLVFRIRSSTDAHLEENTFHCWKVQMEAGDDMMKDVNMVGSSGGFQCVDDSR